MNDTKKPEYRTGPTTPPKSYGSLIAVLLVAVILFGGLASVLGIMNIRLLDNLSLAEEEELPIRFEPAPEEETPGTYLDMTAEQVTPFLQEYYDLPAGIYVTRVGENLASFGLQVGDVVMTIEDIPLPDETEQLIQLTLPEGQKTLTWAVYRQGKTLTFEIPIYQED